MQQYNVLFKILLLPYFVQGEIRSYITDINNLIVFYIIHGCLDLKFFLIWKPIYWIMQND